MNYCNRKKVPTDTVHCLYCEHCLPPGERTEGRMCPDDVTFDEVMAALEAQARRDVERYEQFEQECIEADLRGDPHRFDGFHSLIEKDIESGAVKPSLDFDNPSNP